jgi:hypothetical protein
MSACRRIAGLAVAAVAAVALVACGSGGSSATSQPSSGTSPSSSPSSAPASSPSGGAQTVTAPSGPKGTAKLASTLGCSGVQTKKAAPQSKGASATQCTLSGKSVILISYTNGSNLRSGVQTLFSEFSSAKNKPSSLSYVEGPNWIAVGGNSDGSGSKALAEKVVDKLGGTIKTRSLG